MPQLLIAIISRGPIAAASARTGEQATFQRHLPNLIALPMRPFSE